MKYSCANDLKDMKACCLTYFIFCRILLSCEWTSSYLNTYPIKKKMLEQQKSLKNKTNKKPYFPFLSFFALQSLFTTFALRKVFFNKKFSFFFIQINIYILIIIILICDTNKR